MKRSKMLRAVAWLLCLVALASFLPANAAVPSTTEEIDRAIIRLKKTFRDGEYWNGYNESLDRTGPNPCPCGRSSCGGCSCDCGKFVVKGVAYAKQCFGFACKLGYELFGSNPYMGKWTKIYAAGEFYVGDIIRLRRVSSNGTVKNSNHAYFVHEIIGDTVCLADCNSTGPCRVSWRIEMPLEELRRRVALPLYGMDTTGYAWRYDGNGYDVAAHCPTHPVFYDVAKSAWYYDAVDYTYANGIFNGQDVGVFAPENDVTRAMFVQVLCNLSGAHPSKKESCPFTDVDRKAWYYAAVCWARKNGVVQGTSATEFSPDRAITRQEMCVILYGYSAQISLPLADAAPDFKDAGDISRWAKKAVGACQKAQLIGGIGKGMFAPLMTATRAQAAQIFMSYHKNTVG